MSALLHLRERIDQTTELIARYESALVQPDARPSLAVSLRSMTKLRKRLEDEFLAAAREHEVEVYRYRLIPETRATIVGISESWSSFQRFFSSVYKGVSESKNAKSDVDQFGFAYTFTGSVGVALTLPARDGLFEDPHLVEATEAVMDLSESLDQRSVDEAAKRLGPDVIRSMHSWIETLVQHDYGVGIAWRDREVSIDPKRLHSLQDRVVASTTSATIQVVGRLELVDATKKRFRLVSDGGEKYEGASGDAISDEHAASVPYRYAATIRRVVKLIRDPKGPEAVFELVRLEDVSTSDS